jgi:hypothetical protein
MLLKNCPDLIAKWEDHSRKRGANMINYEPTTMVERDGPNINIITRGGENTGAMQKVHIK